MAKVKKRPGSRLPEPQKVRPVRRELTDTEELLSVRAGCIVLPERGGITLLKILDQAYDEPNVTALDLRLGEKEVNDIRKLDQALERKLQGLLKEHLCGSAKNRTCKLRVRVVAVYG